MKALQALVVLIATLVASSSSWGAIYFSLERGANSLVPDWSAADVLISRNGVVASWLSGADLGLERDPGGFGGDNLNALSFGWDPIRRFGQSQVHFSVDPGAQGVPGSDVAQQVQNEGAGFVGGIFQSQPPADSNVLFRSTEQVGLTRGPSAPFETEDINALSLVGPSSNVYFSIDFGSPTVDPTSGLLSSNIFLNDVNNVFAAYSALGLDSEDDLNALWLWDVGDRGVLDPELDQAYFSLATGSPTLDLLDATTGQPLYSPGDILYTDFTGEFSVWRTASQLGLQPSTVDGSLLIYGDELNALSPVVPEPGTLVMWGLLTAGWPLSRSLRKRRPIRKA